MNEIKPLFLLGTARSGTTWLGNLLASHPKIAGVTAAVHQGIHESHLFSHTRYFFPGRMSCDEFILKYHEEDYFKLTGIERESFCEEVWSRSNVFCFFRLMMEKFARHRNASYWLEKTPKHLIYYEEICRTFPDAVFISIERNLHDTILSSLNKYARPDAPRVVQVAEKIFRYVSDMRAIARLRKNWPEKTIRLRYEDLLRNKDKEMKRVLEFLDLDYYCLNSDFLPDSSFKPGRKVVFSFTNIDFFFIECCRVAFSLLPFRIMKLIRTRRDRNQAKFFPKFELILDDSR